MSIFHSIYLLHTDIYVGKTTYCTSWCTFTLVCSLYFFFLPFLLFFISVSPSKVAILYYEFRCTRNWAQGKRRSNELRKPGTEERGGRGRGRGNSYIVDWTTVLYSTSLTYPCVLQFLWEVLPGSTQSDQSPWVIKRPGSFVLRPRPPSVHSTPTEMHWEVWWACWTVRHWWRPVVVLLVDN